MERPRHPRRDHLQCSRWLLRPPRLVGLVRASRPLSPPSGCCVLDLSLVLRILMLKTVPFACVQFLVRPQGPRFHSCGRHVAIVSTWVASCELSPHVLPVLSYRLDFVLPSSFPRTRSPCLRRPRHTTLVLSLSLPSLLPPLRRRLSRLFAASM